MSKRRRDWHVCKVGYISQRQTKEQKPKKISQTRRRGKERFLLETIFNIRSMEFVCVRGGGVNLHKQHGNLSYRTTCSC